MGDEKVDNEGGGQTTPSDPPRLWREWRFWVIVAVVVAIVAFAVAIIPGPYGTNAPLGWRAEWRFEWASQLLTGLLVGFVVGMALWLHDSRARKRQEAANEKVQAEWEQAANDALFNDLQVPGMALAWQVLSGTEELLGARVKQIEDSDGDWGCWDAEFKADWKSTDLKGFMQWVENQVSLVALINRDYLLDSMLTVGETARILLTCDTEDTELEPAADTRDRIFTETRKLVEACDRVLSQLMLRGAAEHYRRVAALLEPVKQWRDEEKLNIRVLCSLQRHVLSSLDGRSHLEYSREALHRRLGNYGPPLPAPSETG